SLFVEYQNWQYWSQGQYLSEVETIGEVDDADDAKVEPHRPLSLDKCVHGLGNFDAMDLSDVAVRHVVTLNTLNVSHSLDVSPAAVSIAREFRYCVIAVVVGFTAARIVQAFTELQKSAKS
ncbi:MAG: hypothetical protein Q9190_004611, partial [Brigantiaea leucoxantha]